MSENKGRSNTGDDLIDEEDDFQKDKFLMFSVGEEDYGLEIYHVTEIVGMQKNTAVPDMPDYIKGVINLRGKVIPIMDVRKRFKFSEREYDDKTCIVVVNINGTSLGLVVDTVKEVLDIPECNIAPPPDLAEGDQQFYVRGLGKVDDDVKILLDAERLLWQNSAVDVNSSELQA